MVTLLERNLSTRPALSSFEVELPEVEKEEHANINPGKIRFLAYSTLSELITSHGIYASSDKGPNGMYHAHFGRDSEITADFVLEGVRAQLHKFGAVSPQDRDLLDHTINGVFQVTNYQSMVDNPDNGQRIGEYPHEIREKNHEHLTQISETNKRPWYYDNEALKNYDSVDSTPLIALGIGKFLKENLIELEERDNKSYRAAIDWITTNINENGGFIGFTYNPQRKYGGLVNQNWMDSDYSMMHQDGRAKVYPLAPVEVQGIAWAALKHAAEYFETKDFEYAQKLDGTADELKEKFNSDNGFRFFTPEGKPYYAEAIDGMGERVENVTCNPAFLLWAEYNGETILPSSNEKDVVDMLISQEMFTEDAALRTYSNKTKVFFDPIGYHDGPETYWAHMAGVAAVGMDKLGYHKEAERMAMAGLNHLMMFNSCAELVQRKDGRLVLYQDPLTGQTSAHDQAWTAGFAFWAYNRFLREVT